MFYLSRHLVSVLLVLAPAIPAAESDLAAWWRFDETGRGKARDEISGIEDAIQGAIRSASKTLRHLSWFEVVETRGRIDGDRAAEFQVKLQLGFRVDPD